MTTGKSSTTSAELIKQLESKDPAQALKALHKLERVGNIKDLPAIIRVMSTIDDQELLDDFTSFLSNVRSKEAPAILAKSLENPLFAGIRTELTRSCWESQLDYSPHLMIFAMMFIAGDYLLALEAFTVIENTCLEHPVNKELIKSISSLIKNTLPDQPETKQRLVKEMIQVLEPFED
jgi:hypothetical protein